MLESVIEGATDPGGHFENQVWWQKRFIEMEANTILILIPLIQVIMVRVKYCNRLSWLKHYWQSHVMKGKFVNRTHAFPKLFSCETFSIHGFLFCQHQNDTKRLWKLFQANFLAQRQPWQVTARLPSCSSNILDFIYEILEISFTNLPTIRISTTWWRKYILEFAPSRWSSLGATRGIPNHTDGSD